jgi:hypothetical protein
MAISADRPIRYRVLVGTFYNDQPMTVRLAEGYLDDKQNFVQLQTKDVPLSMDETVQIMMGVPGSGDPSTRYADMTASMEAVLVANGSIDAPLV